MPSPMPPPHQMLSLLRINDLEKELMIVYQKKKKNHVGTSLEQGIVKKNRIDGSIVKESGKT